MLGKIRQLKEIQRSLSKEIVEVERDGVKVVVNGKLQVEEVSLNNELSAEEQGLLVKELINEAFQKIQSSLISKLS